MIKGPSLDAIRKFKEKQERKKQEETEKKVKEKLSTLEHRANQGDRKAKTELKKIEKIQEERKKVPNPAIVSNNNGHRPPVNRSKPPQTSKGPTNFEELMRLAKQNSCLIKKPQEAPTIKVREPPKPKSEKPKLEKSEIKRVEIEKPRNVQRPRTIQKPKVIHQRPPQMNHRVYHSRHEDEYEDEDNYESDGFVVDDEDDDAQAELSKTIRSVFRYDKRRCDMREEELDRQYRAIGRVSTFEDLEREERRAARLAANEDARALREEEERKRRKKLRLGKS